MGVKVDNLILREAFIDSGLTAAEVAVRMGWYYSKKSYLGDGSRVKRTLGLLQDKSGRGEISTRRYIGIDTAKIMARAIGIDENFACSIKKPPSKKSVIRSENVFNRSLVSKKKNEVKPKPKTRSNPKHKPVKSPKKIKESAEAREYRLIQEDLKAQALQRIQDTPSLTNASDPVQ